MRATFFFYFDATRIAFQSIFAHKLRSFLTLIGIIIGVASVVLVGAAISGLNTYVLSNVTKQLGANTFYVTRVGSVGRLTDEEWEKMVKRNRKIEWPEMRFVKNTCQSCEEVGAEQFDRSDLKHEGEELFGTQIIGATSEMADIKSMTIAEGRFFTQYEVDHANTVCVIGNDIREKFFPLTDPIGKTLRIKETAFTIIGMEEKLGSMFGSSLDNKIYIPLTTHRHLFERAGGFGIRGSSPSRQEFPNVIDEVRMLMRAVRGLTPDKEDNFAILDTAAIDTQVGNFTGAIAMVVTPITLISLVVGGIVVMNIMLVSVTERTFEIGLRKAVGARSKQILVQFLIESSALASVGGLFGLLLAAALSWVISATTPIPMTITVPYVALSLLVSGGIGMIFGIYPAYKASKLDPIVALTKN
ncbi:MAG: ABC transporter permease [Terriglobia bacterium]